MCPTLQKQFRHGPFLFQHDLTLSAPRLWMSQKVEALFHLCSTLMAPEDSLFRVLQRLDLMSRLGSPASKPSADLPADEASPPLSRGSSRGGWWHPETLHPEMKRRNNLASYNLNSFGLRYGK
uniref:Kisspeptin n=1 Tax=Astyanax mexicanus TaxID=7994 RepID=A0A8B9RMH2_ASTMX